ncbi:protein timeless-like [Anneissia japonica]|nr:protein timeless-like [Anneissia japonica]
MRPQLTKLQNLLLEICYIKLNCPKDSVCQATTLFSVLENKSVPFICYSEELEEAVKTPAFVNLGQKLGVHVTDSSRYFTLIPNFWTAQMCFDTAKKLGDLDYSKLQFETQNNQLLPEQLVGDETRLPDDEYDEGNASLDCDLKQLSITEKFSMTISNSLWMRLVKMQSSQQDA